MHISKKAYDLKKRKKKKKQAEEYGANRIY